MKKTNPVIKKVRIMNELNQLRFRNLVYEQNWEGVVNEQDPENHFKTSLKYSMNYLIFVSQN